MPLRNAPAGDGAAPSCPAWVPVLLPAAFFALYAANAAPGVTWEDSATYHRIIREGDAPWGAAQTHRLYFLILRGVDALASGGPDTAWRLNLFHALLSAAGLGVLHLLVQTLSRERTAGVCAMLALGVSHLFWHYAEVTKVYPFMNLLLLTALWGLARGTVGGRPGGLVLSGAAFGLSLGAHPYAAAAFPGLLLWLWRAGDGRGRKTLLWALGALVGGAAVLRLYADRLAADGLPAFLHFWAFSGQGELVTGQSQGHELLTVDWRRLPRDAVEWLGFLGYQFGPSLALAVFGLRRTLASPAGRCLLVLYATYVAIAFDFNVSLKINFYLPSFLIVAIWCGLGLEPFLAWAGPRARRGAALVAVALGPPLLYATVTFGLAERAEPPWLSRPWDAAYKNRARFYLWPPKGGFDEPRRYAARAFATVPPDAVVIADFQEADVLRYYQREMGRTDCLVAHVSPWEGEVGRTVDENVRWHAERLAGERPLYLAHVYRPYWTGSGWTGVPEGDFDRIVLPSRAAAR